MTLQFKLLLFSLAFVHFVNCNHYRGATISSEWNDAGDELIVNFEFYYRRTDNGQGAFIFCNDALVQNQTTVSDPSDNAMDIMRCDSNQQNCVKLTQLPNAFICKTFSVVEDWSMFVKTLKFNATSFNVKDGDLLMFTLQNTGGEWSFFPVKYTWRHINRKVQSNGQRKYNKPPVTQAFPVYRVKRGCEAKFKIPIRDDDSGDIVKCRFATTGECGNCKAGSVLLDQTTCTLTFPSSMTVNSIVEIQIEDFSPSNMSFAKSSVPLQFAAMLDTTAGVVDCSGAPDFTPGLVPADDSCIAVPVNVNYTGRVEASSNKTNVTEIQTNAFEGYTRGSLQYNQANSAWYFDFVIKALTSVTNQQSVIYYAIGQNGLSSSVRKVNYVLNLESPKISLVSSSGFICKAEETPYELTFSTNIDVVSTDKASYIRFVDVRSTEILRIDATKLIIANRQFKLSLNTTLFNLDDTYSVLFDSGVVLGTTYCKAQSEAITDAGKFKLKAIEDHVLFKTFLPMATATTSSYKIDYTITSPDPQPSCYITQNIFNILGYMKVNCDSVSATVTNLENGKTYYFGVEYTNRCNQRATSTLFVLSVKIPTTMSTTSTTSTTTAVLPTNTTGTTTTLHFASNTSITALPTTTTTTTPSSTASGNTTIALTTTTTTLPGSTAAGNSSITGAPTTTTTTSSSASVSTTTTTTTTTTKAPTITPTQTPTKPKLQVTTSGTVTLMSTVYASNSFTATIQCSTNTARCELFCKLDNEALKPCNSGVYKPPVSSLVSGTTYTLSIYGVDALNQADFVEIKFTADTLPPTFTNADCSKETTCGSSISPDVLGKPTIKDNIDPSPKLEYTDTRLSSCVVKRKWTARDFLDNMAQFEQLITLLSKSRLVSKASITVPCYSNNQHSIELLKYRKGEFTLQDNFCNATLEAELTMMNTLPNRQCDFTVPIKWKLTDSCFTNYGEFNQSVTFDSVSGGFNSASKTSKVFSLVLLCLVFIFVL